MNDGGEYKRTTNEREQRSEVSLDLFVFLSMRFLHLVIDKVSESSKDGNEDEDGKDNEDDHDSGSRIRFSAISLADLFVGEIKVARAIKVLKTSLGKSLSTSTDDIGAGCLAHR